MKNPSTSPPHSSSHLKRMVMMMMKKLMVRMIIRVNPALRKRTMKRGLMRVMGLN